MSAKERSPKRERGVIAPLGDKPVAHARGSDGKPVADAPGSDCRAVPLAYLITFTTYGTWLHGDERGSVDREHNAYRTPYLAHNRRRARYEKSARRAEPITLDNKRRDVVRRTIVEVCTHRGWHLHALNVRTNHLHVVVSAPCTPERVMNDLKSWATRRLREGGLLDDRQSPWTKHGSTRYLWKPVHLAAACRYVLEGQGRDL
ncbi:MAG: transposase [Phycisphaerae bacterium]